MTPQEACRRFRRLQSDRKVVEQTWQAIELFIRPFSGKFFKDNASESSIEWRRRNVYDSTALMASQSLASSLHGVLTSPAIRWFTFQFRDHSLRANHEASVWLEQAGQATYDALQDSNFNLEINEVYQDITSYGTGFLVEEPATDLPNWDGIEFASVPIKEAYFEEDRFGNVESFYRHMRWTASRFVSKFGLENVPEHIRNAYDKASDERFEVLFVIWPRRSPGTPNRNGLIPPTKRPFGYMYVDLKTKRRIGKIGGYYENPVYGPRWDVGSESRWGQSPATIALADVLTLNQLVELVLKAAEKTVDPTILVNERAGFTDLSLGAGEVNVGRDIDGIRPFESATRMDIAQLRIEDLRAQINRYFFVDQLALKDSPAMTATEVQVRYELMHRLLSGTMARLRQDLLHPLVSRTFRMLYRAGQLGEVPQVIAELGPDIDIEYIGPLARAQRSDQATAIERWLGQLMGMAEMAPDVMLVPDWQAIAREAARSLNVPSALLRDSDDVEEDMKQARQQQQQAMQAETAKAAANADKDAAQAEATRESLNGQTAGTIQ